MSLEGEIDQFWNLYRHLTVTTSCGGFAMGVGAGAGVGSGS